MSRRRAGVALFLLGLAGGCRFSIPGLDLPPPIDGAVSDLARVGPDARSPTDAAASLRDMSATHDLAPVACATTCDGCISCCTDTCSSETSCSRSVPGTCRSATLACDNSSACAFSCAGGSSCTATASQAGIASLTCAGGASCSLTCSQVGICGMTCGSGAECLLGCGPASGNGCSLSGCTPTSCPGDVLVCGRDCP